MQKDYQAASQYIVDHLAYLTSLVVEKQYTIQAEVWQDYVSMGDKRSLEDAYYHFDYLSEAVAVGDPALFLDYVAWIKVFFSNSGFSPDLLEITLRSMDQALAVGTTAELVGIAREIIRTALLNLPELPEVPPSFLIDSEPLTDLASLYLQHLLTGDWHTASALILETAGRGVGIKDIYLHVFQPCQREIGRLWQLNQVSVAQEHFSTAVTQLLMARMVPLVISSPRKRRQLIAAAVCEEQHEIGVRMVADFVEMDGWDTYYLGANTPNESILRVLEDRQPDVIAISATLATHVSNVARLVELIRAPDNLFPVKIIVGGNPFNISPGLWRDVGADGFAVDAESAVRTINELILEV